MKKLPSPSLSVETDSDSDEDEHFEDFDDGPQLKSSQNESQRAFLDQKVFAARKSTSKFLANVARPRNPTVRSNYKGGRVVPMQEKNKSETADTPELTRKLPLRSSMKVGLGPSMIKSNNTPQDRNIVGGLSGDVKSGLNVLPPTFKGEETAGSLSPNSLPLAGLRDCDRVPDADLANDSRKIPNSRADVQKNSPVVNDRASSGLLPSCRGREEGITEDALSEKALLINSVNNETLGINSRESVVGGDAGVASRGPKKMILKQWNAKSILDRKPKSPEKARATPQAVTEKNLSRLEHSFNENGKQNLLSPERSIRRSSFPPEFAANRENASVYLRKRRRCSPCSQSPSEPSANVVPGHERSRSESDNTRGCLAFERSKFRKDNAPINRKRLDNSNDSGNYVKRKSPSHDTMKYFENAKETAAHMQSGNESALEVDELRYPVNEHSLYHRQQHSQPHQQTSKTTDGGKNLDFAQKVYNRSRRRSSNEILEGLSKHHSLVQQDNGKNSYRDLCSPHSSGFSASPKSRIPAQVLCDKDESAVNLRSREGGQDTCSKPRDSQGAVKVNENREESLSAYVPKGDFERSGRPPVHTGLEAAEKLVPQIRKDSNFCDVPTLRRKRRYPKLLTFDADGIPIPASSTPLMQPIRRSDMDLSVENKNRLNRFVNEPSFLYQIETLPGASPAAETVIEAGGRSGNVHYWRNSLQMPRTSEVRVSTAAGNTRRQRYARAKNDFNQDHISQRRGNLDSGPSEHLNPGEDIFVSSPRPPKQQFFEKDGYVQEEQSGMRSGKYQSYWRHSTKLPSLATEKKKVSRLDDVCEYLEAPPFDEATARNSLPCSPTNQPGQDRVLSIGQSTKGGQGQLMQTSNVNCAVERDSPNANTFPEGRLRLVIDSELQKVETVARSKFNVKMNLRGRCKLQNWLLDRNTRITRAVELLCRECAIDEFIMSDDADNRKAALYRMSNESLRRLEALMQRIAMREGEINWDIICSDGHWALSIGNKSHHGAE